MADGTAPRKKTGSKYDPVRAAAVEAVILIERGQQTEHAIKQVFRGRNFRPIDIRFILQLVNGTTKLRRRLDHEIKFFLARPAVPLSIKLANILRVGFFQILFCDKVPEAAAVNESVNLARHFTDHKQARLVNAVMRSRLREPEKVLFASREEDAARYLGNFHSYPPYFVEYCVKEFGVERAEHLLANYNRPPFVTYRVNYLKAKPDDVEKLLIENDVQYTRGEYLEEFFRLENAGLPLEDELIKTGKVFVQDESSGLPVRLLNPRPGTEMIDLTAAPGGKATYAAIRMRNKGRVTAVDKSQKRLERVVENSNRLGISIIAPVVGDMAEISDRQFDRVLLDPPCSGWGSARKHSDLRWAKSEQDIENLVKIQTKMIDRASRLVKPGGVMVYSTCTIMRAENDQIVEEFLARNDKFELDSAAQFFDESLVTERGFVKTYPECDNLDGSFCARLKRKLNT